MCGIVGAVSHRDVVADLVEGLRRLEYRGYDSAGVAILNDGKTNWLEGVLALACYTILGIAFFFM
ncbi:MAG: hypothetical protein VW518_09080 [Burkholderiaceae bacterium]